MAKQAKALEAKLRIQRGEEEEGEEEDEEGGRKRDRLWGASKRAYYGADLADLEVGSGLALDVGRQHKLVQRPSRGSAAAEACKCGA